ncbi:hypothetical protein NIIDMKKI_68090 [Mycobacterium kansasii]|uniref:Ricin B lectin domain-containing protein n=1 Tax=Mycobacterium kansasii TaxID=1768 RepID=A0A7G1IPB4_MYCKA|nr:hypothetical protein NIIDMKKI_68090 [Mycobacterium kansasii]
MLTASVCRTRVLAVVGAVFGVAVLCAGTASADGPVQLKSRLGDFCLDAPSGSWFTPVVINPCNGTDFQRWNVNGDREIESVAFPGSACNNRGESVGKAQSLYQLDQPALDNPAQRPDQQ